MSGKKSSLRYWMVHCLGCRNPIPLFAEPIADEPSLGSAEVAVERPFFRAWCMECGREYPYLSTSMIASTEPPLDRQHRQIEFTRIRQRARVNRAHA